MQHQSRYVHRFRTDIGWYTDTFEYFKTLNNSSCITVWTTINFMSMCSALNLSISPLCLSPSPRGRGTDHSLSGHWCRERWHLLFLAGLGHIPNVSQMYSPIVHLYIIVSFIWPILWGYVSSVSGTYPVSDTIGHGYTAWLKYRCFRVSTWIFEFIVIGLLIYVLLISECCLNLYFFYWSKTSLCN